MPPALLSAEELRSNGKRRLVPAVERRRRLAGSDGSPMPGANDAVDVAIDEIDRVRRLLKRGQSAQVWSTDEKDVIRATCLTWFNNHRSELRQIVGDDLLQPADAAYKGILAA